MAIFLSTDVNEAQNVKRRRRRRAAALVCASVLVHFCAFRWIEGRLEMPAWRSAPEPAVTTVSLVPPPQALPAATPAPAAPPKKPGPAPKRPVQKQQTAAPKPVTPAAPPPAGMEAPGTSTETPALLLPDGVADAAGTDAAPGVATADINADAGHPAAGQTDGVPAAAQSAPDAPAPYKVDPPPSARLDYDVEALVKGQKWHGSGTFRWEAGPDGYSISGEAGTSLLLVKITVLNFRSEGRINQYGIAPVLYSEKPRNKSLTQTHFQADNGRISFSASEKSYPYQGGAQDRASVMWQIAGIGRAEPDRFAPGAEFEVFVAGARDAEPWRIRVLGLEEITTSEGKTAAWHLVRAPRAKSYDQTVEFWLAPQQEWYPLRIRYSSPGGDMLDMTLAGIQR